MIDKQNQQSKEKGKERVNKWRMGRGGHVKGPSGEFDQLAALGKQEN